jgi:hypothetical protein
MELKVEDNNGVCSPELLKVEDNNGVCSPELRQKFIEICYNLSYRPPISDP